MRIADLEALQETVAAGSVTAAARRLGCSQSGLSRRLQRLETDLGVQLLDRGRTGVALTGAGETALRCAGEVLDAVARLTAELARPEPQLRGTVSIATSSAPAEHLVPQLVSSFAAVQPGVRLQVRAADSAAVPAALLARSADVGFTGRPDPDRRLTCLPVADDEVVLVVRRDSPLAAGPAVPLSALAGQRLVRREDGSGTQRCFVDAVAASGQAMPGAAGTVTLDSSHGVVAAVAAGLGVGVVSLQSVPTGPAAPVVAVRIEGLPIRRRLWLQHESAAPHNGAVEAFLAHVRDAVAG